jgi:hypothetical protein
MAGPTHDGNGGGADAPRRLPGHFVSDEHRSDTARFLDEVKAMVARRRREGRDPRTRAAGGA